MSETPKKELKTFTSVLSKATSKKKPPPANDLVKVNTSSTTGIRDIAFLNPQLSLFQTFFNDKDNGATNTIELWDTVPKYHISQQAMNKMREQSEDGQLGLLVVDYKFRDKEMKAIIHPAMLRTIDSNGKQVTKSYYPSANEELVEEALRKIASVQYSGFHENRNSSGVVFTLNQVREELKQKGHARTCAQIITSLNILSLSVIEIVGMDLKKKGAFQRSPFFPSIASVNRDQYSDNPHAKWSVTFHPLVTHAIDTLAYRQLDYDTLMKFKMQLGRWLHRWLSNKFTQASKLNQFEIYFKTIKLQSKLLEGYKEDRLAVQAAHDAMQELIDLGIADKVIRDFTYGKFNKILDVKYTIFPSEKFIKQTMAANARHRDHLKQMTLESK